MSSSIFYVHLQIEGSWALVPSVLTCRLQTHGLCSLLCSHVDCLDLLQVRFRQPQQLWAHECTGSVISGGHCFALVLHNLCLLESFFLLFWDDPWVLWEDVTCSIHYRGLCRQLFSAFWSIMSFCINCHSLPGGTSWGSFCSLYGRHLLA